MSGRIDFAIFAGLSLCVFVLLQWRWRSGSRRWRGTAVIEPGVRILLADDNAINRKVALGQLRQLGFRADAATNGVEVLRQMERESYDVLLLDCQMPEMDGYEVTREIRARKIPMHIIAMTASAMEGDREACLSAGMDDYLAKPMRLPALKAVLDQWKMNTAAA